MDLRRFLRERLSNVRTQIKAIQADALVVTHLPNIAYLTNFFATAGLLLVTDSELHLVVDSRYSLAAETLLASDRGADAVLTVIDRSYDEALTDLVQRTGVRRVAFEAAHVSVHRHAGWMGRMGAGVGGTASGASGPVTFIAAERLVERSRVVKDPHELATLELAGALLSKVACDVLAGLAPGRTEREVAMDVDLAMRRAGFERPAFETIVASGPNSARPHATATDRLLAPAEAVMLDFGGVYDGYCVDLTRTVCFGRADAELARAHEAVFAAQQAAMLAARRDVAASTVDRAARDTLEQYGLGQFFGHGTGHGLGLEVHEEPRIGRPVDGLPDDPLLPGMVFTIEPGVYLPDLGGIRIEDDVLVTEEGLQLLTTVPYDFLIAR